MPSPFFGEDLQTPPFDFAPPENAHREVDEDQPTGLETILSAF